jgi:hypothetical protein
MVRRGTALWSVLLPLASWLLFVFPASADEVPPPEQFLRFIRQQAANLRTHDHPPRTLTEWHEQRARIRERLEAAWGGFPTEHCPLEPRRLGEVVRDGYRVEKLLLQTLPGVWMPALAYVPDSPGQHPALLCVHGHWRRAKQEPTVQSRCIGAAKLGFFVLAVDAFGAGERGLGKDLGEYHGEMVAATLLPVGKPLSGIQVYENMRCVDYLQSRPEVDPTKIGITGASGGGNQTMYAGAWDERFGSVVPVCSVGNYQAYLGVACCLCEVVPGALTFTEEWGVLGLTAPRGLMVVNVTKDGIQFSIREARKSLVGAQYVYDLFGQPDRLYHATFRWHHDYHQPIREAMYGWMMQQLNGQGDGSPLPEPPHTTEDPEEIRCFPHGSRPDDWITLPRFAATEGRKLLANWKASSSADDWQTRKPAFRQALRDRVLGGFPAFPNPADAAQQVRGRRSWTVELVPEPGIHLTAQRQSSASPPKGEVLLLNLDGAEAARQSPLHAELLQAGWDVVTLELRATGTLTPKGDRIGRAPDHNSAEWSLWIGRPLLGQWAVDVLHLLDVLDAASGAQRVESGQQRWIVGEGPAGLVALTVAAVAEEQHFDGVAAVRTLASYISDVPFEGQRLGTLAPGILRHVGDVAHLAALALPRRVVIVGGVTGGGQPMSTAALRAVYAPTAHVSGLLGRPDSFRIAESLAEGLSF